jgi:hypothetical protein
MGPIAGPEDRRQLSGHERKELTRPYDPGRKGMHPADADVAGNEGRLRRASGGLPHIRTKQRRRDVIPQCYSQDKKMTKREPLQTVIDPFIRSCGGELVAELLGEAPNLPKNADYLFRRPGVIAELKSLQQGSCGEAFQKKIPDPGPQDALLDGHQVGTFFSVRGSPHLYGRHSLVQPRPRQAS